MIYKFIASKTVKFSGPASDDLLTFEVTYDGGDTWIPYNQIYGGSMSGVDEKNGWSVPHWPQGDSDWLEYHKEKVHFCQHKWVDTGMRKTFCKECDVEGDYNPMTGQVSVVWKEPKK
jgi:hypothetical protein